MSEVGKLFLVFRLTSCIFYKAVNDHFLPDRQKSLAVEKSLDISLLTCTTSKFEMDESMRTDDTFKGCHASIYSVK